MKAPLDPLPIRPLCEYEELREKNIKEREEAMAKSGFFVNLTSYKKEIGLVDNQLLSEAQSGKKKETNIKANHKKKKKDQRIITPSKKRESDKTCVDEIKVGSENEGKDKEDVPIVYEPIDEYYLHDCLE